MSMGLPCCLECLGKGKGHPIVFHALQPTETPRCVACSGLFSMSNFTITTTTVPLLMVVCADAMTATMSVVIACPSVELPGVLAQQDVLWPLNHEGYHIGCC